MNARRKTRNRPVRWAYRLVAASLVVWNGCGTEQLLTLPGLNIPPQADAGPDRNIQVGKRVTLDAAASFDPDDDALAYLWEQVSGPSVELDNPHGAATGFVARESGVYEFALTVTDGRGGTDQATTRLATAGLSDLSCPRANAGDDQQTLEGNTVTLDGSRSSDPQGGVLSFDWVQLSGPEVSLLNPFTAEPQFRTPPADGDVVLAFELTVQNETGCSDESQMAVTVRDRDPSDPCADIECADDGLFCNGEEFCLDGTCHSSGSPCPASDLCDEDLDECLPDDACNDEQCDDGMFCNGVEHCEHNECQAGSPPCREDQRCNESTGTCDDCQRDEQCDDGVFCDGQELCIDGQCVAGEDPCDEGHVCNEEQGDCELRCRDEDCDDGIFCNGVESCLDGICVSGTAPCGAEETCDEANAQCPDSCTPGSCDDGLFCNGLEQCLDGTCTAGTLPCASNEVCDEATDGCTLRGAQIRVVSITPAPKLVGGVGPRTHTAVVENYGSADAHNVNVRFTFVAATVNTILSRIPAGKTVTVSATIFTPPALGVAGQVNSIPITACSLFADGNAGDDCKTVDAVVAVPFWDLRYKIASAPSSAVHCGTTGWRVEVTNVGNVASDTVCSMTGIGAISGSRNWANNLGLNFFTTPNILPGSTWRYDVFNYQVFCNAFITTQFVKVEVNYSAGCFDNFTAGNYDERSIRIR